MTAVNVGDDRQLFVDDYLIDKMQGTSLKLYAPQSAGVALTLDLPWEGVTRDYHTVFQDGDKYRMYYRGMSKDGYMIESLLKPGEEKVPAHAEGTCYAESLDGNPDALEEERYKATVRDRTDIEVLRPLVSHDGLRWRLLQEEPVLADPPFDTQNVPFWDPWRGEYVIYTRGVAGTEGPFKGGVRWIRRATSSDFRHWSPLEPIDTGSAPWEHLYTNGTVPYFRAPNIYLSFPRRFLPDRARHDDAQWSGLADGVFMSSRDGIHWDRRFLESFIRPGRDPRNWMSRTNLVSCGAVPTGDGEISLYVLRNRDFPTCHFERIVLRADGFVSVNAGYAGGEFTTRPMVFSGSALELNYSTSAAGYVRLEVQDIDGGPLPGFAMDECPEMFGDDAEEVMRWENGSDVSGLTGRPVRLRFALKDADLYAFRFRSSP